MRKLLLAIAILLLARPAMAQFGFVPQIVFDPTENANVLQDVAVGLRTYMQVLQAYQLAQQMALAMPNLPAQYRYSLLSQWMMLNPANLCRGCQVWTTAANTGAVTTDPTYGGAVSPLQNYSQLLAMMPADAQLAFQARLANSIYLPQAAVNNDLAAVGMARTNDPQMQAYIQQCQADVLNAGYVSQIQTAQAGNACQTVQQQQQSLTNNLLGRVVDHQSIDAAQRLDQETQAINSQIAKAVLFNDTPNQTAGIDEVIANWGH